MRVTSSSIQISSWIQKKEQVYLDSGFLKICIPASAPLFCYQRFLYFSIKCEWEERCLKTSLTGGSQQYLYVLLFKAIECGGTNQPPPRGCETAECSADLEISNLALKYILGRCHVTFYRNLEWALEAALPFQHCVVHSLDHPAHRSFWFCCPCPVVHYRGQSVPGDAPNAWRTQTVPAIYKSRGNI